MTIDPERLAQFKAEYPSARELHEMGVDYILIASLEIPTKSGTFERKALLCLGPRDSYMSRLFVSEPIPNCGQNWTTHMIFGEAWHVPSINQIDASQHPLKVLAEHLRVMR